jgi:hypothetical protein
MTSPPVSEDEIANAAGNGYYPVLTPLEIDGLDFPTLGNYPFFSLSPLFLLLSLHLVLPSFSSHSLLSISPSLFFTPPHTSFHLHFILPPSFSFSTILGMGDVHDGVNFMRAACVIAVEKAKASFEPMLEVRYGAHTYTHPDRQTNGMFACLALRLLTHCYRLSSLSFPFTCSPPSYSLVSTAPYISPPNPLPSSLSPSQSNNTQALRHRSVHIMHRLFPIVEYMVRKGGNGLPLDTYNKPCQDMVRTHLS